MDDDGEPLSAMDIALAKARQSYPSTSSAGVKRASGVQRGRPRKKAKREESDLSDTDSSDPEQMPIQAVGSSEEDADENDPEWNGQDDNGKPKRNKTKVNYNVKAMFQAELAQANTPIHRPRGRPKGSFKTTSAPRLGQVMVDDSEKREVEFYQGKLPDPEADLPSPEQRVFVVNFDSLEQVKKSSGGFRHIVRALNDNAVVKIFEFINGRYSFPEGADDKLQVIQSLRHMWNKLPSGTRAHWEDAARMRARIDYENGVTDEADDDFVPVSLEDIMKHVQESGKKDTDPYPRMPVNEVAYAEDSRNEHNFVVPACCPDSGPLKNFTDVKRHFMRKHYTAHFYACHFCKVLHESKDQLLKHQCKEFNDYQITRLVTGSVEDPEMKNAYLFLFCHECGFWLPIRESYKGDRLDQAWNFYVTINRYHCGKALNFVVIYSMETIKEEGSDYFRATIIPDIVNNIPFECTDCDVKFTSLKECNEHMIQHNALLCNKCDEKFGTVAHLRKHLLSHMQNKVIFAHYLCNSVTAYPPVHVKDGLPRIGFAEKNRIAYGGRNCTGEEMLHEFTESEGLLEDEKVNNSVNAPEYFAADNDEQDGLSRHYLRHDTGLENEEQYGLPEPEQTETVDKLNEVIKDSKSSRSVLWNASIENMDSVKQFLDTPKSEEGKAEVAVTKPEFLAEIAGFFVEKISLPMMACFDAVSEGLLIKDYDICEECNTIYEKNGSFKHECGEDKVFPIHRLEDGRNCKISCHLCSERFCSIFALRGHYVFDHQRSVDLHNKNNKVNMLAIAQKAMGKGTKSKVTKSTDAALNMDVNHGLLKAKIQQLAPQYTPRTVQPTAIQRSYESTMRRPVGPTAKGSMPLIKPYGENATKSGYICKYCTFSCNDMKRIREHLRTTHTIICRGCGQAFAVQRLLEVHEKICTKQFQKVPMGSIQGTCVCCRRIENLPQLYTHIFEVHMQLVVYGAEDGKIYQRGYGGLFVKNISAPNARYVPPATTTSALVGRTIQNVSNKSVCYLCGFEFDTAQQLKTHLERHPEKWTHCPFCPTVEINSHEEMKAHLVTQHYTHNYQQMICKICRQLLDKNNISHVLYQCMQTKKCAFCNDKMTTAEDLRIHWKQRHGKLFNRFCCSECKSGAAQLSAIKNHTCHHNDMDHCCSCGVICESLSKFTEHFWSHVDNNCCNLCSVRFIGPNTVQLHRNVHASNLGQASGRKIKIMEHDLFTELSEKVARKEPAVVTNGASKRAVEVVDLDNDDNESMPVSPSSSEDGDEKVVKRVVKKLIRNVCEELGEEDDEEEDVLTANVRTESDEVTVVSQHPGYVEDDDADAVESVPSSLAGVLRVINEMAEDDDICVVGEVDHPAGSNQSAVVASVSREKKHKCTMCSLSFVTQGALVEHEVKSHKNDVGGICEKVYGAPTEGQFFICRNCCALFESQTVFRKHMSGHGPNAGISCPHCSGISYNQPLFQQHLKCHARKDRGRLMFGCGTCKIFFQTDLRLYHHLYAYHHIPLLFFCKACSLTTYHSSRIFEHIAKNIQCRTALQCKGFKHEQMIGVFPANQVHFQPLNEEMFERRITTNQIQVLTPSECSHRSFLTLTDSVISCKECYCTMSQATFNANETFNNGGRPTEGVMSVDSGEVFPFHSGLSGNQFVKKASYSIPMPGSRSIPNLLNMPRGLRPPIMPTLTAARPVTTTGGVRTNIQRAPVLATVHRSTIPVPTANGNVLRYPRTLTKPISAAPPQRGAEVVTIDETPPGRVSMPSSAAIASRAPVYPVLKATNKCEICASPMSNVKVIRLHELHTSGQEWFCLNCATAHKTEVDAVTHAYNCNVTDARKKIMTESDFRPMAYNLHCPIDSCPHSVKLKKKSITTLNEFKFHMTKFHPAELPFQSTCGLRFATQETFDKHEAEHQKFEELGIAPTCCPLCGIANQWNLTTDIHGRQTIISHLATHGLHHYSMCRGCFTCFPNDFDNEKMSRHFEQRHIMEHQGQYKCRCCHAVMPKDKIKAHVVEKHIVRGYKARQNPDMQIVIKTGGCTRLFMGLPYDTYADDDERTF